MGCGGQASPLGCLVISSPRAPSPGPAWSDPAQPAALNHKKKIRPEEGFEVEEILRRRGGRPSMGSAPASVESVRLDPELSEALRERADREGRTNSDLIRDALRRYLEAC